VEPESAAEECPGGSHCQARTFSKEELALPPVESCGTLACYRFDGADRAVAALIFHEKPLVVGFGEAHAPASYRGISTVSRFSESILASFSLGVSSLLVELLAPPQGGCETEKKHAQTQSDLITQGQSDNTQNEYLALGRTASSLGVVPDILRTDCDDLARIASPDGGVLAYMSTIARLFAGGIDARLSATKPGRPLVIAYGGALHNDLHPRPGREAWSYGPQISLLVPERYLEIDLIIPELITESESWHSMPWYEEYRTSSHTKGTLVLKLAKGSYALFFEPETDFSTNSAARTPTR
jgi:hypothetical protein